MDRSLIDQYEAVPAAVRRAVVGLTQEDVLLRPGPGAWSIQEVIIHLAESDCIAVDRMKRILTEDNPTLLSADETAYAQRLYPHEQSLDDALTLIEVGRRQWVRVLRLLPDEAFARKGTHNVAGEVTLGGMVASYVRHPLKHLEFVYRKRENLNKPLPESHR